MSVLINNNDDDDIPQLSAEALKALQEFYAEAEIQEKKLDENWVYYLLDAFFFKLKIIYLILKAIKSVLV